MKKLLVLSLFTLLGFLVRAQDKVVWTVSYNSESKEIEFKAKIADGWHLYSQHISNEIGPVPTNFVFTENPTVKWFGPVTEPTPIQEYDPNFEATLNFFKNEVVFKRKITPESKGTISGYINYMVCNDITCIPPVNVDFTITIP